MKRAFLQWCKDRRGATAIEYCLIAGGVGLAISALAFTMGDELHTIFQYLVDKLDTALAKS